MSKLELKFKISNKKKVIPQNTNNNLVEMDVILPIYKCQKTKSYTEGTYRERCTKN